MCSITQDWITVFYVRGARAKLSGRAGEQARRTLHGRRENAEKCSW